MQMSIIETTRREVLKALNVPYEEANKRAKDYELKDYKPNHNDLFYKHRVFDPTNDINVLKDLKIELEFVETESQHDLWDTFRVKTSSIACHKNVGRNIRILVKDKMSKKYLGILSLGSDIATYSARDQHIGWTSVNKFEDKKLNYVMNINCCVGLQPIAFNYNIGKLLVAICYSKEVHDYFFNKYGHYMACITTFSINGKSIQYDRMKPYLQLVGYTKGWGSVGIPENVYNKCIDILKKSCDIKALTRQSRFYKLRKVFDILGLDHNLLNHGQQRGVYIGFVGKDTKDFLCGVKTLFDQTHIKPLEEIVEWWKTRWAIPRFQHLEKEGRLQFNKKFLKYVNLYNVEKTKRYVEKKKEELGVEEHRKQLNEYMRQYRNAAYTEIPIRQSIYESLPELAPDYLAGFFDGDGSLYFCKNTITVCVGQCDPKVLLHLKNQFGGNIEKHDKEGNKRTLFRWRVNGSACEPFLKYIENHVIIEAEKIQKFLHAMSLDSETAYPILQDATQLTKHGNNTKPYDRVNLNYIAGFFDAEGDVEFALKPKQQVLNYNLTITQKLDIKLLEKVRDVLGYGTLDKVRLNIYSKNNCSDFISKIKATSIVKQTQLQYAQDVLMTQVKADKIAFVSKIKDLKHATHVLDKVCFVNDTRNLKKKIIPDHQREMLSERMTGENNPNYGKIRSETHATKIAMGQKLSEKTRARRKVTDAQIVEIRKRYRGGEKMYEIGECYGVSHQYISNIIQGKLLTREEIIAQGPSIANSKLYGGESRKACKSKLMFKVIKYCIDHKDKKFTLIEKESKNLFGEEIKCSRFKHWVYGSVKIPETEFPIEGTTYAEYLQMIEYVKNKRCDASDAKIHALSL